MDALNQTFKLTDANAETPAGHHHARFAGLTHEPQGEYGPYYIFQFTGDDETVYKGFATVGNGPTPQNKLGRWLCGFDGRPLQAGVEVTPSQYVGRRYVLTYEPGKGGKPALRSFTPAGD